MRLPLLATLLLAACATSEPADPEPAGRPIPNLVSSRAAIIPTNYGELATFTGDRILRYPHFDLLFFGTKLNPSGPLPAHLLNFELRSPDGRAVKSISWHPLSGDSDPITFNGQPYRLTVDPESFQVALTPGY